MNVIARTVAFVIVLIAADVKEIELVNQPVFLEHIERAIHGDAMHARINLLSALKDGARIEVAFRVVHHLQQHAPLPREAHTFLLKRSLQSPGAGVSVNPLPARHAMIP